jgi:organic hydroperoxide reductase OsmC/OhrA
MGFQAIRVKVVVEGDAPHDVLDEIVQHANFYSPVANTMRNPIPFAISMAE